jgi:MFS family permease
MRAFLASVFAFAGGFAVMVLEIVGARFLAKDFGGSFYVWISQIGMVLMALAAGYAVGGYLADRLGRARFLALWVVPAGVAIALVPEYAPALIDAIILRHPADQPIPLIWQKLDPAVGSAVVFFLPCFALATLSPYLIRVVALRLAVVGRISGLIYAASTVGSIAGVFVSGYVLIDHFSLTTIFRLTGLLTVLCGSLCPLLDCGTGGSSGEESKV